MKAKLRRGAIIFLSVLLTAAMLCGMTVSAADTADRGVRLYRGTFYYTGNKDTFYYGDSYFDFAGDADNEHLRTFSAALAFSVLGTSGEDTIELMTNIGMEPDSIVMEDMVSGTPDTIGTVIAKKQLKDQPLVAVAIRGSDYAGEWANNVTVGTEGDASGFAAAAAKVAQRIQTYLNDNDIAKAKIWVVGYSRAGGVANLIGKAMNEDPGAFRTNAEDIYVYTYEAPRCSENDTVYKNIHNIFDVNDLVPHFYPESWGLHLNINVFEKLKQMDSYYTAGVRIKPGDVIIGQNRYTFDENGWPLEDIVRASGFTEQDIEIWRNGYELRINNELTEIAEPDMELYIKAAGKFDKSMSRYKFYELSMTKTVGFRTYPVDKSIKLKDNPVCLTVPQEIAKKCVRYGVRG
ncbi:lipase family protein [Ruminococcus sp.]|uniref:lipase family protein n=1 Tax=Ruminococcus sp. TaxID=41978 RepID=UPI003868C2A5